MPRLEQARERGVAVGGAARRGVAELNDVPVERTWRVRIGLRLSREDEQTVTAAMPSPCARDTTDSSPPAAMSTSRAAATAKPPAPAAASAATAPAGSSPKYSYGDECSGGTQTNAARARHARASARTAPPAGGGAAPKSSTCGSAVSWSWRPSDNKHKQTNERGENEWRMHTKEEAKKNEEENGESES